MKLYNIDEQEWRTGNFDRGDSWRSDIAYQCEICHTKTNRWVMGGWPSMGPRILRADTAMISAVTLIQEFLGDFTQIRQ